jgi:mono/diheme cytochrome c family protein
VRTLWLVVLTLATASLAIAAGDAAAGKASYDKACKSCHGADGTPNPGIAKSLKVDMLHLGDPAVQKLTDDELKAIVVNGKGKMKGVKSVAGKSVDDVVAYMRTLKK